MMRPVHFEILADNPEKAAEFYRTAFGWEINSWGGSPPYWLVTTGPEGAPGINGGIMKREFRQAVINTIAVDSLKEVAARVESAGGKVILGPNEIPGIGAHMYCADPEGNLFGLLQPAMK
ncbi:MAG: VOC family protein [candidate division Zixibacteria bacterium]|nr:VOC family protein [candidate division Zixibacteria bacterium]